MEDVFVYVPGKDMIVRIAEGTGDNLWNEDIEQGFIDYLTYDTYAMDVDLPMENGGMLMLKEYAQDKYESLFDAVDDVLELEYGERGMKFIRLIPEE